MNKTHTPGPWFLDTASDGSMEIAPQIGYTITVITPRAGFERDIPNAVLMAAAPELLTALEMFVAQYAGNGHDEREKRPEMQAARAAIAKATRQQCCNNPRGFVGGICDHCDGTVQPHP